MVTIRCLAVIVGPTRIRSRLHQKREEQPVLAQSILLRYQSSLPHQRISANGPNPPPLLSQMHRGNLNFNFLGPVLGAMISKCDPYLKLMDFQQHAAFLRISSKWRMEKRTVSASPYIKLLMNGLWCRLPRRASL